ncbi:MAG: hypothetical protein Q8L47_04275 [bacterium]|nr:hypothetical protein [bacterium]
MLKTSYKFIFLIIVLAIGTLFFATNKTSGEGAPTFWVTWSADNYSAPEFLGKSLPSYNTLINVTFELVQNGKIITLNSQEVIWYLNGVTIKRGLGIKEFSFRTGLSTGANLIKIELPNFKGGSSLIKSVEIPVKSPEVILDSPYTKKAVTSREINLRALPYYFNATRSGDLSWIWQVNGKTPEGSAKEPNKITIEVPADMPKGGQILTKIKIINSSKKESAETMALFTIK